MKKKVLSALLVGTMILGSSSALAYNDTDGHWAENDIKALSELGVVKGYEDDSFKPDNYITREEAMQIISNYIGEIKTDVEAPEDAKDRWSTEAIQNLISRGIVKGYEDGTIKPQNNITRAEFSKIVAVYLESEGKLLDSLYSFDDIIDSWAIDNIRILSGNNLISGYGDKTFKPNNPITRAEVARIISNFDNISKVGITGRQLSTIYDTKNYILYGQGHLGWAQSMNWSPTFLNNLTERDLIDVYLDYVRNGESPSDTYEFGWYLTFNAPIQDNWKEMFESDLYSTYGKKVVNYIDLGDFRYGAVIEGLNPPHGYYVGVNSRTGAYHG